MFCADVVHPHVSCSIPSTFEQFLCIWCEGHLDCSSHISLANQIFDFESHCIQGNAGLGENFAGTAAFVCQQTKKDLLCSDIIVTKSAPLFLRAHNYLDRFLRELLKHGFADTLMA